MFIKAAAAAAAELFVDCADRRASKVRGKEWDHRATKILDV